ncbi:MAG: phosphotransferase [Lachnospiraceae bacterium]|nr:phosphotransferase [Lachnospiraceae bacterium]
MNNTITKILFHWGVEKSEVKQIYRTAWQVGEQYVLKEYQNQKTLERNLKILQILDGMNVPVGKIVPACDNRQYISLEDSFYFLAERLPGKHISHFGNDTDLAFAMGEIIADLHMAFRKCEDVEGLWDNSLLDEMNGWVKSSLEKTDWKYISREAYEKTTEQLAMVYDSLPVQLIHRDVHFGNFLFENGRFSGYIDFDLSQRNIRIFDICYFLMGLLCEEEKADFSEEMWFLFLENVFAGYESRLELSEMEKRAVPYVMECIELLFVAYFEREKDVHCAENAFQLYEFVKNLEGRIYESLHVGG